MSDQTNQIILSIKLDDGKTREQVQAVAKEIEATKNAQNELTKAREAGKVNEAAYNQQSVNLSIQLKSQQGEQRALTSLLANYQKVTTSATDSVDQLKAKSALLTAQYNAMSEAERTGTEAGKILTAELNATNKALLAGGAAVGDMRRNVGNYAESMKSATVGTKELKGGLTTITDTALKPFQATLDKGTGLFAKYKSGADLVKTGLGSLRGAGETGALGFKSVAAGIALTGLGVFLLLLSSVVGYFSSTNEGSKILKQGLAALGAVVTTVANTFTGAGKALVQAFHEPEKALDSLMAFLKSQVVNRLAAFGVLIDGIRNRDFKKITDSVIQFNLGITNGTDKAAAYAAGIGKAVSSAADLEAQFQKLKKARAVLEADEILEKGRVEELIRLSKDRTTSASERLNKLREAGKLESELSAKSIKQITDELDAIKQRNAAKGLSKTSDEIQEERDKQKEYNATVVERNNTLATIKARQSKFILEERAELAAATKARADAAQQAKEDAIKLQLAEVEDRLLAVGKGTQAELALLKRKLELSAALTLASEKKTAADRKLLLDTTEVEKQRLQADFDERRAATAKTEQKREYDENLGLLQEYLDKKAVSLEKQLAEGKIGEKQYQEQLVSQEQAGLAAKLVLAREYKQDTAAIEKQITAQQIAELRKRTEKQKAEYQKQLGVAVGFGQEVGSLFADTLTQTGATLEDFAAKALILILDSLEKQVLAQQAAATAASLAQPDSVATFGATGLIRAAVINGLIVAAFETAKAVISASTSKQFAAGTVLDGPGHGHGGIQLFSRTGYHYGEAEGGEAVINKRSTALFLPLLSQINQAGGGRPLLPGAAVSHLALGGLSAPLAREQLRGNVAPGLDYNKLAQAMSRVNVKATISDVKAGLARDAFTQSIASS